MKIAALVLFSVMMMTPSATLSTHSKRTSPLKCIVRGRVYALQKPSWSTLEMSGAAREYKR
jgi:hypothetical protein